MTRWARVFVWGVIVVGAIVVTHSIGELLAAPPPPPLWAILMTLTAFTGLATLRIPGMQISFSISDTFSILAALLVGPAAGAVTAALDGLVLSCRMLTSRRTVPRVLFNMACPAIATWTSAEVFLVLATPDPLAHGFAGIVTLAGQLAVFGALDFALTTWTVAAAVALDSRSRIVMVWRQHCMGLWITYFGGVFAAMLMMALDRVSPTNGLLLIAPLPVLLYVAFRHAQARAQDQIQHLGKMNKVYVAAIEALAQAVDTKDQVTHDHVRRVQTQSMRLARAVGVTDEHVIEAIKAAALLHDVGKIGIPEHILNKPGRLTSSEFEIMKQHAAMGAEILSVIDFPYPLVPIVRHHHENWDGTGYPDGLAGEAIPIGARILQVVDCFDALTTDRPYRRRIGDTEALQVLVDRRGTMYDPRIVDIFLSLQAESDGARECPAAEEPARPARGPVLPRALEARGDDGAAPPLQAFYELGRIVPGLGSLDAIGEKLWAHLRDVLPADAFVVYGYDGEAHALVPRFCSAAEMRDRHARIALGEGLSGWVGATGRAMINADPRLELPDGISARLGLHSALAVASMVGDRLVAVLTFYSSRDEPFSETHCRVAEAAAAIVAGAAGPAAVVDATHAA